MCGNHPSNKGGMTSVINQIREHNWASDGIELDFIPTYMPGNPIKKALFFAASYIKIAAKLAFDTPDVVHMHMSYRGSFTRKYLIHNLCKKNHVPDIIHLHGSEFEKWYNAVSEKKKARIRSLLKETSSFVVLGEKWENVINSMEPRSNVIVISNGVEIPQKTVTWNPKQCNVLFLGVLIKRKGVADLLKTIQSLKAQGKIGTLRFILAGTGEEENELKHLAEEYEIGQYVDFIGWVSGDKKQECLMNSQVMVLPSYNEGLPVSLLEAMSYGMPVVSTDVGDIPSVIKHRENGMLFSPGDTKAMEECLLYMTNEESYAGLAENARKTVVENYSLELFLTKIRDLYKALCA